MIPIGLVTRNRHRLLDVTLRSLSASRLPEDQEIVVFDDDSDDEATKQYLYTDKEVPLGIEWPRGTGWTAMGLDTVESKPMGTGIDGKILVVPLGSPSTGVVNASCRAFVKMTEIYGTSHGIIIGQDDVVFNIDWLEKILAGLASVKANKNNREPGLVCGCWINKTTKHCRKPITLIERGGITAQCYYVTPAGVKAVLPWAQRKHAITSGFDNKFCANVRSRCDVYRIYPGVCQHVGRHSTVRSQVRWHIRSKKGRVDYSSRGPYPLADEVKPFMFEVS